MKVAIRRNVFETNSSSTHSLSYTSVPPAEYSFECDSAWSRMIMLKALINNASTPNENSELASFYKECLAVFSAKENVEIELIPDYLGIKLSEKYPKTNANQILKAFLSAYDSYDDTLCSYMFSEGCLDCCYCGFDYRYAITGALLNEGKTLKEDAVEYLYGEKKFFAKEKYSGCFLLDGKRKY